MTERALTLKNLRTRRIERGLSIAKLSQISGVARETISKIEAGGESMDWIGGKLAAALQTSTSELEGSDE